MYKIRESRHTKLTIFIEAMKENAIPSMICYEEVAVAATVSD